MSVILRRTGFFAFGLASVWLAVVAALPAMGAVTWAQREVTLPAVVGVTTLEAVFAFTNAGDQPVAITSVKPSCGCTTAALTQTRYGPGELGEIRVVFEVGSRVGPQVKQVVVRTDAPESPVTTLTLRTDIRERVQLAPQLLFWRADEPREPKALTVTIAAGEAIEITEAVVGGASELTVAITEGIPAEAEDAVPPAKGAPGSPATGGGPVEAGAAPPGPGADDADRETPPAASPRVYSVLVTPPQDQGDHRVIVRLKLQDAAGEPLPEKKFLVRIAAPASVAKAAAPAAGPSR